MATQYPLQSKVFIWPLSAHYTQGHIYTNVGGSLFIDGNIRIQHWQAGNLGLTMQAPTITPQPHHHTQYHGGFCADRF